jgi:hypothetical protein
MGKRKTTEQFKQEVFDLVGNDFVFEGKYKGAKTKLTFTHNVENCGRKFPMDPTHFLRGQRCPNCKGEILSMKLSKSTETFKKEVLDLVGDEYTVEGEYISHHEKILMRHSLCESTFEMTPSNFLRGHRCTNKDCKYKRKSEIVKRRGNNSFDERFVEYDDDYEVIDEYNGWNENMTFKHKKCGCVFRRTPAVFFRVKQGMKCPDCLRDYLPQWQSKTQEQFEQEVFDMYKDEYTVLGNYVQTNEKISMRHNLCGTEWDIQPANFLNGNACPRCRASHGEKTIRRFLENSNIDFTPQKTFDELIGVGGRNLSYDFYIPQYNVLVEYQGEYHDGTASIQTEEGLKTQQEHDRRKREYAKSHGIDLLEIWYWDFDNIEGILTEYFNLYNEEAS